MSGAAEKGPSHPPPSTMTLPPALDSSSSVRRSAKESIILDVARGSWLLTAGTELKSPKSSSAGAAGGALVLALSLAVAAAACQSPKSSSTAAGACGCDGPAGGGAAARKSPNSPSSSGTTANCCIAAPEGAGEGRGRVPVARTGRERCRRGATESEGDAAAAVTAAEKLGAPGGGAKVLGSVTEEMLCWVIEPMLMFLKAA